MLTLSLDEYGDFEGLTNRNAPIYIAGILFDDGDILHENKNERRRIEAYYRAVINEALNDDAAYPQALHSNGDRQQDHDVVRPVKKVVSETLSEFLGKGTYRGKALTYINSVGKTGSFNDRKGRYHVFVILKSDQGLTKLLSKNANSFAKDDYASNLYFHMADETVSRLIFYNPVISNIKNVSFNIASRATANMEKNSIRATQYKKQGYGPVRCDKDNEDTSIYYSLTNGDVYRTAIAKEILASGRTNLRITDFRVRSISYKPDAKNMEYLYLADSICSILGYGLPGDSAEIWLKEITKRVGKLNTGKDNLVFGYDEIDVAFSRAWEKYQDGDYYEALTISFDAIKQSGAFAEHYRDNWFSLLISRITESRNTSAFANAVRKLNESLHNNYLDQEECLYVLGKLEVMIPNIEKELRFPEAKRTLYMFYDTAISAYCHIGDSRTAIQCFEKCTEYEGTVGLDTYLQTSNKMVVNYCDFFEIEEAKKLADENVSNQQLLSEVRNEIHFCNKDNSGYVALGKSYSQRGQVYAFQRDSRAEDDFRQALNNFKTGSADYKITQSYMLHYYIDTGNMEDYLKEATDYFGGYDKLVDQLDYILVEGAKNDPLINMKYSLYVLVKGIYSFRISEITGKVWDRLQRAEQIFGEKIGKKDWILTGHPSELIFKYMRLIAIARNELDVEKKYAEKMRTCLMYHGATEDVIRLFGETVILKEKKETELCSQKSMETCQYMKEQYPIFKDLEIPMNHMDREKWLKEKITFMFC